MDHPWVPKKTHHSHVKVMREWDPENSRSQDLGKAEIYISKKKKKLIFFFGHLGGGKPGFPFCPPFFFGWVTSRRFFLADEFVKDWLPTLSFAGFWQAPNQSKIRRLEDKRYVGPNFFGEFPGPKNGPFQNSISPWKSHHPSYNQLPSGWKSQLVDPIGNDPINDFPATLSSQVAHHPIPCV